jgi:lysophospholipase L1-like esterase
VPKIIFLGDSVTIGVEANGNFPQHMIIPWAELENGGFLGTSTTDLNPFEQLGEWPATHPAFGSYWNFIEQKLNDEFPDIIHMMFGVNDAEGVNETCSRVVPPGPRCPLKAAEYRGNLENAIEEIDQLYDVEGRKRPLILLSSPTFAPRSFLGFHGPGNRRRLEGYEGEVYRLVRGASNVCFGINGREVLFSPLHFRFLDWHPRVVGHEILAGALQNRFENLQLQEWAAMTQAEWEVFLDFNWIENNKPDWFSFDLWRKNRSPKLRGRFQWHKAKRRWLEANRHRGQEEWAALCVAS